MIQKMRRILLFILIAFTFSTLFHVVHIGYADNHPPTREEFDDIVEEKEKLEERVNELENPERTAGDVINDVVSTAVGVVTTAVGYTMVTASVPADTTIVGIPAG